MKQGFGSTNLSQRRSCSSVDDLLDLEIGGQETSYLYFGSLPSKHTADLRQVC
jgi:hypothetical protein